MPEPGSAPGLLQELGLRAQDLIAGFAGGLVNAFVFKRSDPFAIMGSVVVGALTANYLGEVATKYLGLGDGAASFIVGLCGMALCQAIIEMAAKWKPSKARLPPG